MASSYISEQEISSSEIIAELRLIENDFIELSKTNSKLKPGLIILHESLDVVELMLNELESSENISLSHFDETRYYYKLFCNEQLAKNQRNTEDLPFFKQQPLPPVDELPEDLSEAISQLLVYFDAKPSVVKMEKCSLAYQYLRHLIRTADLDVVLENFEKVRDYIPDAFKIETFSRLPHIICECVKDLLQLLEGRIEYYNVCCAQLPIFLRARNSEVPEVASHASIVCCAIFYYAKATDSKMFFALKLAWSESEIEDHVFYYQCIYIFLAKNYKNCVEVHKHVVDFIAYTIKDADPVIKGCGLELYQFCSGVNEKFTRELVSQLSPNEKAMLLFELSRFEE